MYAIMAGGGKVGRAIATDLLTEGHQVTIIELIPSRTEQLLQRFDVLVIHGDATDVRYLEQARPERADIFCATTRIDDVNYVACQLAKITFNVPRVLSRVNSPRNEELFTRMGIEAVSTTTLISRLIREQLTVGDLIHLYTLRAGEVNLVEVDVPKNFPSYRRNVAQLKLPAESVLVCVFRGAQTVIPRGDTLLEPGDQVIALTTPELEQDLRAAILDDTAPGRAAQS